MKRKTASPEASNSNAALNDRVLAHMPLVSSIAEDICRQLAQPLDRASLTKYGVTALIQAARAYAPQSRVPFQTFIRHRIKGAILDGLLSGMALPHVRLSEHSSESRPASTVMSSVGTPVGERSDEFLLSLFGLQRSLQYCEQDVAGPTVNVGKSKETLA